MSQEDIVVNKRSKYFKIADCSIKIDSLTLAPQSVFLFDSDGDPIKDFIVLNNKISLDSTSCTELYGTQIKVNYRVLPFNVEQEYFHLDSTMMKEVNRAIYIGSDYNFNPKGREIIDANGLDYNGSFSRGFSVGNSQSLVLNSNFNLQLAGDLGNDISVVAAISDDNIPIQPEGNTQQIQEFDRVFIKVAKGKTNVIAGDYNLERPDSYFMNFFKKAKGLLVSTEIDLGLDKVLKTNGNFAVSRGKFARQTLDTREGNQGPYKLIGNNGERFLIVLSGSEKVYLDGRLLERGLEYDYVIDYNRAEVTFTPNRIIGRESRIIIEYEYRDNNYLRSIYTANTYYSTKKYDFNFNFYNEQDSKTATGDIVLDSTDIRTLIDVGDDIGQARVSSIRPVTDSLSAIGRIKYRLNPNPMNGDPDTFFLEFSTDQTEQLYVAAFIEIGEGQGRYVIDETSLVNGRVYKYVGPNNGVYEPFTTLTPPEKRQLISLGAKLRPKENINIGTEISLSNNDINRFASIGNDDNVGLAGVVTYNHSLTLSKKKKIFLTTDNKYEFTDENFKALNPYRTAEFNRDWNITNTINNIEGRQNLIESALTFSIADSLDFTYSFKSFTIAESIGQNLGYSGTNQNGALNYRYGGLKVSGKIDLLSSEGFGEETTFRRPRAEISQIIAKKSKLQVGVFYDGELNERRILNGTNSLLLNSFSFDLYRAYVQNSSANKLHYRMEYSSRNDFFPDSDNLSKAIVTNEINTSAKWAIAPNHGLSFNFGIRDFQVDETKNAPANSTDKKTLIGRLDHNLSAWDGLILTNTNYIINSGQEPKVEFFFEKVEPGQGDYIYIGNQDSVLINANFRFAPDLGTGEFIRLSLINNEFISTNNQSLTQSLRLDPKKFFSSRKRKTRSKKATEKVKDKKEEEKLVEPKKIKAKSKKLRRENFLSRFSTISTFRISKKINDDGTSQESTFLNFSTADTASLVSYNSLISNTLFINRGNPKYDLQFGNKVSENIFTQISGLESRGLNESFMRSRIRIAKSADFILNLKRGNQDFTSRIFPSRALDIDYYSINPEVSYRPSASFRINLLYTYDDRQQQISNMEEATSHDLTGNITYRQATNTNINFSLSFVNVNTNVAANSPIEFDLLNGLKEGKNYIWNTLFTKRLSNNIDLTISYEGRKSGEASTVHIARAQVKATF